MDHRHLRSPQFADPQALSLAAVDDIIGRGKRSDWAMLRDVVKGSKLIAERVIRVCTPRLSDPYEQRYHLWFHYARRYTS